MNVFVRLNRYAEVLVDLSTALQDQLRQDLRSAVESKVKHEGRVGDFAPILAMQAKALAILRDAAQASGSEAQIPSPHRGASHTALALVDDNAVSKQRGFGMPARRHTPTVALRRCAVGMVQTAAVLLAKVRMQLGGGLLHRGVVPGFQAIGLGERSASSGSIGRILGNISMNAHRGATSGRLEAHNRQDHRTAAELTLRIDLEEAEMLLTEAMRLRRELHSGSRKGLHPAIAEVQILQSHAAFLRSDFEAALELCRQALRAQQVLLGAEHPLTQHTIRWAIRVAGHGQNTGQDPQQLVTLYEALLGAEARGTPPQKDSHQGHKAENTPKHVRNDQLACAPPSLRLGFASVLLQAKDYPKALYVVANLCKEINAQGDRSSDTAAAPSIPLSMQAEAFATLGYCRRALDKKPLAVEAFRKSASICAEVYKKWLGTKHEQQQVQKPGVSSFPQRIAKQMHALAEQIRLCGDVAAAMKVFHVGDKVAAVKPLD